MFRVLLALPPGLYGRVCTGRKLFMAWRPRDAAECGAWHRRSFVPSSYWECISQVGPTNVSPNSVVGMWTDSVYVRLLLLEIWVRWGEMSRWEMDWFNRFLLSFSHSFFFDFFLTRVRRELDTKLGLKVGPNLALLSNSLGRLSCCLLLAFWFHPRQLKFLLEHVLSGGLVEIPLFLSDWQYAASLPYSRPRPWGECTNPLTGLRRSEEHPAHCSYQSWW